MRIIAKNHDYYDSALAFGHDEHVVFERREEKFDDFHRRWAKEGRKWPDGYRFMSPMLGSRSLVRNSGDETKDGYETSYHPFTVAFCGKLYPGIRVRVIKPHPKRNTSYIAYTFEDYSKILKRLGIEFIESRSNMALTYRGVGSVRNEKHAEEYFDRAGEDHVQFLAEQRKPIVIWDEGTIRDGPFLYFNPELKKWKFYKVFDAYTAFQELDMFISGVMTHPSSNPSRVRPKRPNPVDISDEDLRDKKGFDDMSFKKAPTKNR